MDQLDPVPAPPDEKLDFDDDTFRGKKANCKFSIGSPSSKRRGDVLTF